MMHFEYTRLLVDWSCASSRFVARGRADPQLGTFNNYRFPIPDGVYGECRKRLNPFLKDTTLNIS